MYYLYIRLQEQPKPTVMKIYIANHKNESFEDCKARVEAAKKQADQKKAKEADRKYVAPAYNPFNDLN